MKHSQIKRFFAALVVLAQMFALIPAYATEADFTFPLTYDTANIPSADYALGTAIDKAVVNSYGIHFNENPSGAIWSVQRINSVDSVNELSLRFSTQSFSGNPKNLNLMSLNFAEDTVNNPPEFNGQGYVFESEFSVLNRDDGYINLILNGENSNGDTRNIAEIRFVPTSDNDTTSRPGVAYAVDALGNKVGDSKDIVLTSSAKNTQPGQLYYVKVMVDLLNNKYSAWLVVRKTNSTDYVETEPTEEHLLVENADLNYSNIKKFTGLSFNITKSEYGNGVWLKNISVKDYTPTPIATEEPTATEAPADGIALRMAVLSDFQYGRHGSASDSYSYDGNKFKKALKQCIAKAGGLDKLDVLMIPGDISHNSSLNELNAFVSDLSEIIPYGSHTKVMFLRGNHDAKPNKQNNFITAISNYDPTFKQSNNIYEVNGYQFVMVSQDTQRPNDESSSYAYLHSPDTISWFDKAMDTAEDKSNGKPIFVGMHPNATNTVYGSYQINGIKEGKATKSSYWSTNELYDALKDHSNAVTFSGHSHWVMPNERSIHQKDFTSLNTGSVNNMEADEAAWDEPFQPKRYGSNENESTGYYIEVNINQQITVHKMDFYRGTEENPREFGEPWTFDATDKSSWKYTDDRDSTAPYFAKDDKVTVSDISSTDCSITFPQAADADEQVVNYKVEFVNQSTQNTDKIVTLSSYYWLKDTSDYPESQTFKLSDFNSINSSTYYTLSPNTTYKVKITALDNFYNESTAIESEEFTTEQVNYIYDNDDAVVSAYYSNTSAMDNSNYAIDNSATEVTNGHTPISYNSELKRYESTISTDYTSTGKTVYSIPLSEARRNLLATSNGYTIESYAMQSSFPNSANVIFGAAQSGGFDVETTKTGKLEVYVPASNGWLKKSSGGSYPGDNQTLSANKYYHIVTTVTPSQVKVYINGELADTLNSGNTMRFPSGSNMKNFYGVFMGADYRPEGLYAQSPMTGKFVFGKLYQKALTADEVKAEHDNINTRKTLTKADDLNTLLTETLPAKQAEKADSKIDKFISEGWLLMGSTKLSEDDLTKYIDKVNAYLTQPTPTPTAEPTATPTVAPTATPTAEPTVTANPSAAPTAAPTATAAPTTVPTAVPTVAPTVAPTAAPTVEPTEKPADNINLRFAVLSDFQYGRNAQNGSATVSEKVKTAIQQVIDKSKDTDGNIRLDAILVPGDITHNSNPSEYQSFISDLNSLPELKANNIKLMFLRGNHDVQDGKGDNFVKELSKYDSSITQTNNVYDIKGYKFVCVSQDTYKYNDDKPVKYDYVHSADTISWFENAMNTAAEQSDGKPIFVATHPAVKDTVFGSSPITGFKNGNTATSDYWGTTELYNGLKNHSNAIAFSGHSHWTMANVRSIFQKDFTSLNTGAVNNMEIENCWDESYAPKRFGSNEDESSGYYIEVTSDEKVIIHRMDFFRKTEFSDPWTVDVNDKANWKYTDDRDKDKPYFDTDTEIDVSNVSETSFRLNFIQAKDNTTDVNNYKVQIVNVATNEVVKTATPSSYYWLKHANQMPAKNYWDFSGLEAGKEYKAIITAYDTYYNESTPIESEVFKTKSLPAMPDKLNNKYHLDITKTTTKLNADGKEIWDYEKNGITIDSSIIWSPAIEATNSSMQVKAMRFSTRSGQTGKLMKLDFANDEIQNPESFNSGTYVIDTEVGVLHKLSGYISYKLYGKNTDGEESTITDLRFNASSSGNSSANAVDANGEKVGSSVPVTVGAAGDSWVGEYECVRTIINLDAKTYSMYVAPVKTGTDGEYHEPEFTSATLLVNNAPFNASDISEISAFGFDLSGSPATFGVWLTDVSVSQVEQEVTPDEPSAEIVCDKATTSAGENISFTAEIKSMPNTKFSLYSVAYDENGKLIGIEMSSKDIENDGSFATQYTVPENAKKVKLLLWDNQMKPYDVKTITVE